MLLSRRIFIQNAALGLSATTLSAASVAAPQLPTPHTTLKQKTVIPHDLIKIISLDGLEKKAKSVMSEAAYAYIAHGAGDEWTYHENRRAFNDYPLLPHRLSGVAADKIDIQVELLGHKLPHPLLIAPMGAHMFVHPEG